jgi:hypothetical protein
MQIITEEQEQYGGIREDGACQIKKIGILPDRQAFL